MINSTYILMQRTYCSISGKTLQAGESRHYLLTGHNPDKKTAGTADLPHRNANKERAGAFFILRKGGERKMEYLRIFYCSDDLMRKIRQAQKYTKDEYDCNDSINTIDLLPTRPGNYDSRIESGFRLSEMAQNGYPSD